MSLSVGGTGRGEGLGGDDRELALLDAQHVYHLAHGSFTPSGQSHQTRTRRLHLPQAQRSPQDVADDIGGQILVQGGNGPRAGTVVERTGRDLQEYRAAPLAA